MSRYAAMMALARDLRLDAVWMRSLRQSGRCGAPGSPQRQASVEAETGLHALADQIEALAAASMPERPPLSGWRAWWFRATRRSIV